MKYGMDETKIQVNFLKALINKKQVIFCEGLEGKTGLSDGSACFFIPNESLFLDKKDRKCFSIKSHISSFNDAVVVNMTDEQITTEDVRKVIIFESKIEQAPFGFATHEKKIVIGIDQKYLQFFGSDVRYYATSQKMPLFVTNDDQELLAFILPVNIRR
jgi:hypothetical protein